MVLLVAMQASAQPLTGAVGPSSLTEAGTLVLDRGRPVTIPIVVSNASAAEVTVRDSLSLPEGWISFDDGAPFVIEANAETLRLAAFYVPDNADVRSYPLSYWVDGNRLVEIEAVLPRRERVAALALYAPPIAEEGRPIETTFEIQNQGNVATWAYVTADASYPLAARLDSARYWLAPGETRRVSVHLLPQPTIGRRRALTSAQVEVQVGLDTDRDRQMDAIRTAGDWSWRSRTASTFVTGPPGRARLATHSFPLTITTSGYYVDRTQAATTDTDGLGGLVEVDGSGTLQEDSDLVLGLTLRSPTVGASAFGSDRDFYQVRAERPGFDALAGDGGYSVSNVLAGYGFGAGGLVQAGPAEFRALAFTGRRRVFATDDYVGASTLLRLAPWLAAGGAGLYRQGVWSGTAATARAVVEPGAGVTLSAEAGVGVDDDGASSPVGSVEARYGNEAARLRVQAEDIGAYGPFTRRNELRLRAIGSWEPSDHLRLRTTSFYRRSAPFSDPSAPRDRTYQQAQLSATYRTLTTLSLDQTGRRISSFSQPINQGQITARLSHTLNVGRWSATPAARAGRSYLTQDTTQRTALVLGGSLSLTYRATEQVSLSATGSAVRGQAPSFFQTEPQSSYSGMLLASYTPSRWLRFQATGGRSYVTGSGTFSSTTASAGADMTLPWGHRLSANYRYNDVGVGLGGAQVSNRTQVAQLSYTVPLDIPLHRSRRSGLVTGTVVDEETGAPVEGVAVFAESSGRRIAAARTDAEGVYAIPEVPTGDAVILVDTGRAGTGLLKQLDNRHPVTIAGADVQSVAFAVTPAASVEVRMTRVDTLGMPGDAARDVERRPLANAVLSLEGPDGVIRAISGFDGRAFVGQLPAGEYTVRIVGSPMAGGRAIGADSARVTVDAGGHAEVAFEMAAPYQVAQLLDEPVIELVLADPAYRRARPSDPPAVAGDPAAPETDRPPAIPIDRLADEHVLYRVRPGDWVSRIAQRAYGSAWPAGVLWIVQANGDLIRDPDLIYPGWQLRIPAGTLAHAALAERLARATPPSDQLQTIRVASGETLTDIAQRAYGTEWRTGLFRLVQENEDRIQSADQVQAGWILRVPPLRTIDATPR